MSHHTTDTSGRSPEDDDEELDVEPVSFLLRQPLA
jgi:hypothetical protein